MAREGITRSYPQAARALNEDWSTHYDGKQIQRWTQAAGQTLLDQQSAECRAYEQGVRPPGPANDPDLLVIGMDGGRVQGRDRRDPDGSRWREDKVLTISRYRPGDARWNKPPQPLVTTYLATMHDCRQFGVRARVEAERRGIRQARQVVVLGDGAAWIDTLHEQHFARHVRIVDWYHAVEHLHEVSRAVHPDDTPARQRLVDRLETALWHGQVQTVVLALKELAQRAGPAREADPPDHPRRVLARNVGYFQRHAEHMNYPAYRNRGWPIATGMTESGVKQFNQRVKGTEQFWHDHGVEPVLALRSLWLSEDDRWNHYWWYHQTPRAAA